MKTSFWFMMKYIFYLDSASDKVSISESSVAAIKHLRQIILPRYKGSHFTASTIPRKEKIFSAILLDSWMTLSTVSRAPSHPPPQLPQMRHSWTAPYSTLKKLYCCKSFCNHLNHFFNYKITFMAKSINKNLRQKITPTSHLFINNLQ